MESNGKSQYIMYTMDGCPYCNQAKALFEHYGASYEVLYDRAPDWDAYPGIYKVGKAGPELIGGFTELARYSYEHGL